MQRLSIVFLSAFGLLVGCGGDDDDEGTLLDSSMDVDTTPVETGVITGTLRTASINGPPGEAEGVAVSVLGTDITVTTDAAGFYSLEAPVGLTHLVASKDEHWSYIFTLDHDTDVHPDTDFEIVPSTLIATIDAGLTDDFDAAKGFVFVKFDTDNQGGGETASVPTAEGAFTFDGATPTEGNNRVAGGSDSIILHGVPPGTTTVTVQGAGAINTCVLDMPDVVNWPVQGQTLTLVTATCTPI